MHLFGSSVLRVIYIIFHIVYNIISWYVLYIYYNIIWLFRYYYEGNLNMVVYISGPDSSWPKRHTKSAGSNATNKNIKNICVTSEPNMRVGEGVFCELQKQQFLESLARV